MIDPKPIWIIERDTFNEGNPERMAELITSMGMQCDRIPPFSHHLDCWGKYKDDDCIIVYGSVNLVRWLMKNKPWIPTAWFNAGNLECNSYYSQWGQYILQQDYAFIPWAEIKRRKTSLYQTFGEDNCLFIRPDNNVKTYDGKVVPIEDFDRWYKMEDETRNPDKNMLNVVARPRNITHEWRFVICDRKIITHFMYKFDHKANVDAETDLLARDLAIILTKEPWQPDVLYVMDICQTKDEQYHLLEIGSVNSAGLYGCVLAPVIEKMTEYAIKEWKDVR